MDCLHWKPFLVVAAATLTQFANTGWAQSTFNSQLKLTSASSDADESIFDSHLVPAGTSCNTVNGTPCVPSLPGTQPTPFDPSMTPDSTLIPDPTSPQPVTPDNVFNPSAQNANPMGNGNTVGNMQNLGGLGAGQGALTAQSSVASMMQGGYLDPAAPMTMFRLRYDDAMNNQFPDRGEYFYAECGCFRSVPLAGGMADPKAKGPQGLNTGISYQDVRSYFEYAFNPKVSVFADVPVQFIQYTSIATAAPGQNPLGNQQGLGDITAGFKYAFIARQDRYVTFQLRTYFPTGDSYLGLGTGHYSIEPSLLFYEKLSDKTFFQGQLTEWTPINVTGYASDVLQYGGGLGYILYRNNNLMVTPLLETVGWTFLGGRKFSPVQDGGALVQSASGDTIFNVKPGVRVSWGNSAPMMNLNQSLYVGFGIPVTDQQFYANLFRAEYRIIF